MYCDGCGSQLNAGAQFCTTCGKQLAGPTVAQSIPVAAGFHGRVGSHLKTVGILWVIYGVLRLFEMFWLVAIGRAFLPEFVQSIVSNIDGFPAGFPLDRIISRGLEIAGFWGVTFAVLELVTGWALLERRHWARILALVLGFLALLRFPFGTALGIYTLWVLLPATSEREYDQLLAARGALASTPAAR